MFITRRSKRTPKAPPLLRNVLRTFYCAKPAPLWAPFNLALCATSIAEIPMLDPALAIIGIGYTQLTAAAGWDAVYHVWPKKASHPISFLFALLFLLVCQALVYGLLWWFLSGPNDGPGLANIFAVIVLPLLGKL